MQHKASEPSQCPVARSLEHVGEWWSILIMRDALYGLTRFDQFQQSLGIAPNMLTRRLNTLVESGLLQRHLYCEHPPRHEYLLTDRGRDFKPVVMALHAWGNRNLTPEGRSVVLINQQTGQEADPVMIDRHSGLPITDPVFKTSPGPAANTRTRQRHGAARPLLSKPPTNHRA
jgi:DNA-binding HxlR family transcriptional regulator